MCCYHWCLLLVLVAEAVLQFNSTPFGKALLTDTLHCARSTGDSVLDNADMTSECTEGLSVALEHSCLDTG